MLMAHDRSLAGRRETLLMSDGSPGDLRHYCRACGAIFSASALACPVCGTVWFRLDVTNTIILATLLTELQEWFVQGILDRAAFERLRSTYEAKLPQRPAAAAVS